MKMQAVWGKLGVGVCFSMIGLSAWTHAQANVNDNMTCAVYLDIAANDLTPAGGFTIRQAQEKLIASKVHLAILAEDRPVGDVVNEFIEKRRGARIKLINEARLDKDRLYTTDQLMRYAQGIANHTETACPNVRAQMLSYIDDVGETKAKRQFQIISQTIKNIESNKGYSNNVIPEHGSMETQNEEDEDMYFDIEDEMARCDEYIDCDYTKQHAESD